MRMNASTVFKLSCSFPFKLHVFIWSRFIVIKLRFIIVFVYARNIYFAIFAIKTLRKSCDFIIGTVNLAFETLTCLNGFLLVTIRLNHD